MEFTRRSFALSSSAFALTACSSSPTGAPQTKTKTPAIVVNPGFEAWVTGFKSRALAQGINDATFSRAFNAAGYIPEVIERDSNQFQTRRTLEDYLAIATSDERVTTGRAMLRRYSGVLSAIQGRYGVPPNVVTAIWGVESRYGERRGDYPVISALATLGYASRRARFFEGQLIAALKILQRGDVTLQNMTGSWAGAMGHTQFIPTTFLSYAVDFTGDGRRNVWEDDPTDALASAAAYLSRSGWRAGEPWGFEVSAPDGLSAPQSSKSAFQQSFSNWSSTGLRRANGGALPTSGSAGLIRPAGRAGPYLLIQNNFRTLLRYNNSDKYVIAVGHLSDRLSGGGAFQASFGADEFGLTLNERKELQRALAAKGYDIGTIDGVLGKKTEAAIAAYQKRIGIPVTGQPSRLLLSRI